LATLFWDASALIKRYTPETGSDTVAALFEELPIEDMGSTFISYSECYSILHRRRNGGLIDETAFQSTLTNLDADFLEESGISLLAVRDKDYLGGTALIARHNLNSTDATLLHVLQRQKAQSQAGTILIIASDLRLLRAASSEHFQVLDPMTITPDEAKQLVRSL
jgi:predicted nucleic acid-binding protein